MYSCKGICRRNKVERPVAGTSRYLLGQKLCTNCETYMLHVGPHCPCCGSRLRSNPKSGKLRRTLQKQKSMIQ